MTNCKNCGAPIEPFKSKCEHCGTYYFDFTAFDMDSNKPVYVKFKTPMGIITALAYPILDTIDVEHHDDDYVDYHSNVIARFRDSTTCDLNVHFRCIPNLQPNKDNALLILEENRR